MRIREVFKRISWKLTFIYALIFSLVLLLLSASLLYGVRYYLYRQARQEVNVGMAVVSDTVRRELESTGKIIHSQYLKEKVPPGENMLLRVIDGKGNIIWEMNQGVTMILDDIGPKEVSGVREVGSQHFIYRSMAVPTSNGVFYLQVIKDMRTEYGFIRLLFLFLLLVDGVGMGFALLTGYYMSSRILKPIDRITSAAQNISARDLGRRIEVKGPDDELTRLARTFNEMIERLEKSFAQQSQFVSNASHQLRTPIAVVQGYINLLDRWGKKEPQVLDEAIEAIKNETASMNELIEKLLFLARSDSGSQPLEWQMFAASELIDEVVEESRMLAAQSISGRADDGLMIYADRRLLKELLRALVNNSIKFTPPSGRIHISAYQKDDVVVIEVTDNGPGIDKEEVERVFERFYRGKNAGANTKTGSGLGLSIVRSIAEMHGGKVLIDSQPGQGTKVSVYLAAGPG